MRFSSSRASNVARPQKETPRIVKLTLACIITTAIIFYFVLRHLYSKEDIVEQFEVIPDQEIIFTSNNRPSTNPIPKPPIASESKSEIRPTRTKSIHDYIGCYGDAAIARDLREPPLKLPRVTVGACIDECGFRGFTFAGLQYGLECRCSESFGRYHSRPLSNCEMQCRDDDETSDACGAKYANAIYLVPKDKISDDLQRQHSQHPDKFMTLAWNAGRTNNQLRSLESAIAYAKYYNRTLILSYPRKRQDITGLDFGFWDMEHLRKHVRFLFEHEAPEKVRGLEPKEGKCKLSPDRQYNIPPNVLEDCDRIHLRTQMGVELWPTETKGIFSTHMRPAKYIRDAVDTFMKEHFPEPPRVAVHNRMMKEGAPDSDGEIFLCRQNYWSALSRRGQWLQKKVRTFYKSDYDKIMHTYWCACAMAPEDINAILDFHNATNLDGQEKFFLATDDQVPEVTEKLVNYGAVRWTWDEFHKYSRCRERYEKQEEEHSCNKIDGQGRGNTACQFEKYLCRVELAIFDMWTARLSEFFIGSWKSTFTESVCKWRGWSVRHDSNMCYIKERWDNVEAQGFFK